MSLTRRIKTLEARPRKQHTGGGRQRLAEYLDELAARLEPDPAVRANAQEWLRTEWPLHLERIKRDAA